MRKAILSTLCSAFVIPGLGQVMNQHLRKGVIILAAMFVLFLLTLVKLYQILSALFISAGGNHSDFPSLMDRIKGEDLRALLVLLAVFAILWLYSVIDAYLVGRKIDRTGDKEPA